MDESTASSENEISQARIDAFFGDVLLETTTDERTREAELESAEERDSWHLENRPPHHLP